MAWQDWLGQNLPPNTRETSGYRSPQREATLGGPASSYHSRGTSDAPGAIDIGGPADQLRALFEKIKEQFKGRINELYLNIPGGQSLDIKNNRYIGTNPEAGRPQHLHVALQDTTGGYDPATYGNRRPAAAIPEENRGAAGVRDVPTAELAPQADCEKKICGPKLYPGNEPVCYCWSDIWVYGASLGLILGGAWLVMRGKD